jgi:hypothetical protein
MRKNKKINEILDEQKDLSETSLYFYTRKLIESLAEEMIGRDQTSIHSGHEIDDFYCIECGEGVKIHPMEIYGRNELRAEQRLKVKEILSILNKYYEKQTSNRYF